MKDIETLQHLAWIATCFYAITFATDRTRISSVRAVMVLVATYAAYMAGW